LFYGKTPALDENVIASRLAFLAAAPLLTLMGGAAFAIDQVHDEIQVYNAEIAEVGQWTYQQHLNYAAIGQTAPEFPGGFTSNHSLQGTPEFAYGLAPWWEAGFYLPFAVDSAGQFLSDGAKIRSLFVVPNAAKRDFFYGINFELGYELPKFSQTPWGLEIRPIIGSRNTQWELIANPIVDLNLSTGEADFAPALRIARNLGQDRFIGLEYYADFGRIGAFLPLSQQSQQLFAVTDFKVNTVDVELGVGSDLPLAPTASWSRPSSVTRSPFRTRTTVLAVHRWPWECRRILCRTLTS
jgi:hypothetical protein